MITQAILTAIFAVVGGLVSLLPTGQPLGLAAMPVVQGFGQMNAYMPLAEAVTAVGVVLLVEGGVFGFRLVVTLWHMLPFT